MTCYIVWQEVEAGHWATWFIVNAVPETVNAEGVIQRVRAAGLGDLENSEGIGPLEATSEMSYDPDLPEIDWHNLDDSPNTVRNLRRQIDTLISKRLIRIGSN